jgi:hypothetical protein
MANQPHYRMADPSKEAFALLSLCDESIVCWFDDNDEAQLRVGENRKTFAGARMLHSPEAKELATARNQEVYGFPAALSLRDFKMVLIP